MAIHTVGIDIAKTVFLLVALDEKGAVLTRKKFSRPHLLNYTANFKADVIGMEACSGAHFLARALVAQGHQVRLMPAEHVRAYVKSNKNDFIDAEAIAEAVLRPTMRYVLVNIPRAANRSYWGSASGGTSTCEVLGGGCTICVRPTQSKPAQLRGMDGSARRQEALECGRCGVGQQDDTYRMGRSDNRPAVPCPHVELVEMMQVANAIHTFPPHGCSLI